MKKTFLRVNPGERFYFNKTVYECMEPARAEQYFFFMRVREGELVGDIHTKVNIEVEVVPDPV